MKADVCSIGLAAMDKDDFVDGGGCCHMGLFGFSWGAASSGPGIDALVAEARGTEGAVILDVREPGEYASGHIPGAVNIPVGAIACVAEAYPDVATPLYVHCKSGARSARACNALRRVGYTNVTDMGGIMSYHGELERGGR